MSEYTKRDHTAQGEHYLRHVSAMTAEGLHTKSAIAGELAHRDIEIERLTDDYAAATHLLADRDAQIERLTADARDAWRRVSKERDALREDAERFAWIAAHCRSTAEHWSGRWSIVIEGPAPTRHDDEDAFCSAIDAARALRKGTP